MYIYGKNVAKEAIKKEKIKQAFLYEKFKDRELLDKIINSKIKVNYLSKKELDKKSKNHQGIILEIDDYKYKNLNQTFNENIVVILDHLEDPHNMGAIIRTCESAGIKNIIIPKNRSVKVNATVIKTSAGAIENVNIIAETNLINTIKKLKKQGFWIIGTDMQGQDYKTIDYQGKIAIVIGNEGKGMSRLVKENCDFIASINMKGKINSLNASVAAALVIYEAVRKSEV